ncbi:uncharacterized protein LOC131332252 isoform X4 [Rhododendron vialii]|uniref:uncharacterized protein LOC131332252 isoform X4 n=1 Tax=Rhododendron vialii TaxID=182163 RepID=UPI00265E0BA7|nr:uncharacterized protein LOC131332252 isoform X4 [Rhododendron vialii]
MNLKLHSGALSSSRVRHEFPANRTLLVSAKIKEPEAILRRRLALRKADRELSRGNYKTALTLVKQLQGKPGGLRGFGAAKQVPRRISSLNQLKPGGIDTSSPQYLVDSILDSIKRSTEFQLSEEVSASELESLTHESVIEDHLMCTQVDTGGILQMNLSRQKPSDGIYKGKISSTTLNRFSCVILGGLVAEHLVFGYSQGLHGDVEKLNRVLRWMGFEESEIDSHLKWAVMNTLLILVRHQEARSRLAETMALGKSVGSCIDVIENNLNDI